MSVSAARRELVRVAGTQLDPVIVRAFLNVSVGRLWRTIGFGAWIAQIPQLGRFFSFGGWASSGVGMGIATATTATVLAVGGRHRTVAGACRDRARAATRPRGRRWRPSHAAAATDRRGRRPRLVHRASPGSPPQVSRRPRRRPRRPQFQV